MTTVKAVVIVLLVYFLSFSLPNGRAQYQGQALNDTENVNVTSSDEAVYNLTNGPSDIQTMKANNGTDGTNPDGSTAEIITNASQQQQPQAPLQSPPSLQQQPLSPIIQPEQQPIYPTIPISIVLGASTYHSQGFQPSLLHVNIGTTITWTNYDRALHTVTSGFSRSPIEWGLNFDSGILSSGDTFSLTAVQSGIFYYHCNLHPEMAGTVIVS